MRKFVVFLLVAVSAFFVSAPCVSAQKDTLYVSSVYTTHLVFDTEISYVDVSSPVDVAVLIVEQNPNVLAVLARAPFDKNSSLSVLESNGDIHTFIVAHRESPDQLVLKITSKEVVQDSRRGGSPAKASEGGDRVQVSRTASPARPTLSLADAVNLPKTLYHIGDSAYGVSCNCENIVICGDMVYFVLSIRNASGKDYACSDAMFDFVSKKARRREVPTEGLLVPKNSYGVLSTAVGGENRVVYGFPNFTLLKNQVLRIRIYENGGQRQLEMIVSANDVNKARIWK